VNERNWAEIWALFTEARDADQGARARLLADVPPEIAAEVRRLIEEDGAQSAGPAPGGRYGRYTLIELLGHGGMGQVFSARDSELGRMVAIKFLNLRTGVLPEAVRRLVAEAQTAGALNHPNLITVHEILRHDSGVAVVSELVKGKALRAFCGAPRPVREVAAWGAQMARGLAAAHAESIVHGDIKPENVMIRADGYIKILDFGISRQNAAPEDIAGLTAGTVGYMSPEQIRGEPLTPASDLFSLGVALLELTTGRHPFCEETPASTALAIGAREVEVRVPPIAGGQQFARLLRSMLEKDPSLRPTAAAAAAQLERIATRKRFGAGWLLAAAAAAGIALVLWLRAGSSNGAVTLSAPAAVTSYEGIERQASLSPDGKRILFVWSGADSDHDEVYLRTLAGDDLRRITNDSRPKFSPVWSPDGRSIAWESRALDGSDTFIMVAPVGGAARMAGRTADHEGFYGIEFWPDSGSIVTNDVARWGRSLVRLNLSDGGKTFLTTEPGVNDQRPVLSPDRRRLLFLRSRANLTQVCVLDLTGHTHESCYDAGGGAVAAAWLADSRGVLYADSRALWQMSLDGSAPRPVRLAEGEFLNLRNAPDGRSFTFNRTLVDLNIWRLDTATGRETRFQASSAEDSEPRFSPDGGRVVFRSKRSGAFELYLCAPDGTGTRPITSLQGDLGSAVWSPDGKWIAFDSDHDGGGRTRFTNIAVIPAEGGPVRRVTPDDAEYTVPGWSADGRFLYCRRGNGRQVVKVSLAGGPPAAAFDHEMFDIRESPAGRFLFAMPERGSGIRQRFEPGGAESIVPGTENALYRSWDLRGGSLYFLGAGTSGKFTEVSLDGKGTRKLPGEPPRRVFHGPRNLSASPDGKTILFTSEDLAVGDIFLMEVRKGQS
jgi:Tol biopolymer transport system component